MRKILGPASIIWLAASAVFGVEVRPVQLKVLPPAPYVLITPQGVSPGLSPSIALPVAALDAVPMPAIAEYASALETIEVAQAISESLGAQPANADAASVSAVLGGAFDKGRTWEKAQPLPPHEDVASPLANLDAGHQMSVSHSYPGKPGVNPQDLIARAVEEYIAFKGMPDSQKHFVFKFFEIGDPVPGSHSQVVQAIAKLVAAGIKTTILTDFNQSAEGVFAPGEPESVDFERMTYKDNNPGRALKYIREELGFKLKYGEGPFTVLSGVPLYNPADKGEKPLMHDKGVFAAGPDGRAYRSIWAGTANMNATQETDGAEPPAYGGRYNRMIRSEDAVANQVDWEQVQAEIESYDKRSGPNGVNAKHDAPRRVSYASGEFRELAFTNGKQNPNDRIVDMLLRGAKALWDAKAAGGKPSFELQEMIFSHFVLTNTPEVDALRKYLAALKAFYPGDFQKRFKIYGVFDQKFISPSGWGEAAAFDGLLVQRPMGRNIYGFSADVLPMFELYGYIRLMSGVDQVDPDGVPTKVHLWHDKTTMMKVVENGVPWTYAWTRSLNGSMHFESAESQDMYRMLPGSKLAKDFEDSIKEVVKAEPEFAVPFSKAVVMSWLSDFTQHTYYDEGMLGYAEKMIAALIQKNYQMVFGILVQVVELPTKHVRGAAGADIKDRILQYVNFLNWYAQEARKDSTLYPMNYRKAINIGVGLTSSNPWNLRAALATLYYNPGRGDARTAELLKRAWSEGLKMKIPMPEPRNRGSGFAAALEPERGDEAVADFSAFHPLGGRGQRRPALPLMDFHGDLVMGDRVADRPHQRAYLGV